MKIVNCKNVSGITHFQLQDGQWTTKVDEKDIVAYYKKNPKAHIWWDEKNLHNIQELVGCVNVDGKNWYAVRFTASDKLEWTEESNITTDMIEQFYHPKKPYQLTVNLKEANRKYASSKNKPVKNTVNHFFACSIPSHLQGSIVYLEAQTMLTTEVLLKHGVQQLKRPINFDQNVVHKMIMKNYPNTEPFYRSLHQEIELTDKPIAALFADYCSTFEGTEECCPKEDLELLFSRKLLLKSAILACTFCLRDNRDHITHQKRTATIEQTIKKFAAKNNYQLRTLKRLTYVPSMFFLCFVCK